MVIWPVAGVVRVVVQQCLEGHRFTSPGPAQIDLSLVGTWTEDPLRSRGWAQCATVSSIVEGGWDVNKTNNQG